MISTEHVDKNCVKVLVTYLVRIYFEASQNVTMPNGSSHSLGETSNEVLRKISTSLVDIFCINALIPKVNVDFCPVILYRMGLC